MATKIYDCMITTSTYKDRNGNDKKHWENIGAIWQDKDSNGNTYNYMMMKRCFNPAGIDAREGSDSVRISLFKPKTAQQQNGQQPQQQQNQPAENFDNFSTFDNFGNPVNDFPF